MSILNVFSRFSFSGAGRGAGCWFFLKVCPLYLQSLSDQLSPKHHSYKTFFPRQLNQLDRLSAVTIFIQVLTFASKTFLHVVITNCKVMVRGDG
jgi:hypothetical protein